jgi:cell division protein ZipA
MDTLRWIILGVGVLLVIVVYLVSRAQRPHNRHIPLDDYEEDISDVRLIVRDEPEDLGAELDRELAELTSQVREESEERGAAEKPAPARAEKPARPTPTRKPPRKPHKGDRKKVSVPAQEPELIIVLHVAVPAQRRIHGAELRVAFDTVGLEFGDMDIYHRYSEVNGARRQLFSVANMIKPGTLRDEDLDDMETPGVSLFMRLPGPLRPLDALDEMLDVSRKLAAELDAQVLAENRIPLTQQLTEHMRDRVRSFSLEMERARA